MKSIRNICSWAVSLLNILKRSILFDYWNNLDLRIFDWRVDYWWLWWLNLRRLNRRLEAKPNWRVIKSIWRTYDSIFIHLIWLKSLINDIVVWIRCCFLSKIRLMVLSGNVLHTVWVRYDFWTNWWFATLLALIRIISRSIWRITFTLLPSKTHLIIWTYWRLNSSWWN